MTNNFVFKKQCERIHLQRQKAPFNLLKRLHHSQKGAGSTLKRPVEADTSENFDQMEGIFWVSERNRKLEASTKKALPHMVGWNHSQEKKETAKNRVKGNHLKKLGWKKWY